MDLQGGGFNIIKNRLSKISLKQAITLFWTLLKHPFYITPTISASIEAINHSQKLFGNLHFGHSAENAYRHALWAYLIADKTKDANWAKNFTSRYEDIFPNQPIDKQMDLHNNEVGLRLYNEFGKLEQSELQKKLDLLFKQAQSFNFQTSESNSLPKENLIYF